MYAEKMIKETLPLENLTVEAMLANPDAAIQLLTAWKQLVPSEQPTPATRHVLPPITPRAPEAPERYLAVRDIPWLGDELCDVPAARQQAGRKLCELTKGMGYPVRRTPGAARAYHDAVVGAFRRELSRNKSLLKEFRTVSF